jgi:hypothetical protein
VPPRIHPEPPRRRDREHRIVVRNGHTGAIIFWATKLEYAMRWVNHISPKRRNPKGYWIEYWDEPARLYVDMSIAARASSRRLVNEHNRIR